MKLRLFRVFSFQGETLLRVSEAFEYRLAVCYSRFECEKGLSVFIREEEKVSALVEKAKRGEGLARREVSL
jgi:hypothetical protein